MKILQFILYNQWICSFIRKKTFLSQIWIVIMTIEERNRYEKLWLHIIRQEANLNSFLSVKVNQSDYLKKYYILIKLKQ